MKEQEEKNAKDAQYLADLKKFNNQRGAFSPFSINGNDLPEIRKIKNRINNIVEKELVLQDFKD